MISYSQNFEDVMLDRALGNVPRGIYIDVGAWHPDLDSVTRHFYEKGWSGINIEPVPEHCELLRRARPRDTNLNFALSDKAGKALLHQVGDTSGMSSLDRDVARHGAASRGFAAKSYEVPTRTLADVCAQHLAGSTIHFLKIDVEGHEEAVIRGGDWSKFRPWIVVVEAVDAATQKPAWEAWEPLLLGAGYRFAWFDGLNRFYVRSESADLLQHFLLPPNIFDAFITAREHLLEQEVGKYRSSLCARAALRICRGVRKLFGES